MKPLRLPLLLAALFVACTSAPPLAAPAPASPPASPRIAAPESAPPRWWLAPANAASPGAGVEAAYRELLAGKEPRRTVVVGVIDSGVDIAHEDLDGSLWVNPGEVAGNGVDDDGNGYVDDVHGWNFIGGADGRNVADDTYEVTRLFAACRALPAADERVVAGGVPCAEIEAVHAERRGDAEQMLAQVRGMGPAVERAYAVLRDELGRDSLTAEAVRAAVPMRLEVRQARQIYLQLAAAGITPAMIAAEEARLERLLDRGLNPAFDPRPIVGDDYDDLRQRRYGNADVVGPDASHGTGVAGIIAAERGNGIGEDGIAPARIMVLRAVPDGDERDKDVANAIRYAVDHGAHIINMSFGKGYSPGKRAVDEAVRYAEEKGVLLVHAAGNEGDDLATTPSFPTRRYDDGREAANWIEVGASGWRAPDALAAEFSNYGRDRVDVFAPGVDITAAAPGNGSQTASGTSFAAPVVSGLAALIMAYYPELSAADVRRVILESARPYGTVMVTRPGSDGERVPFGELSVTGGIVDARAALELAEKVAAGK
ncbi:MAG TPA: S8 family peptidase [Longimicrobiales bacterium]|nr:S8 family peptidase [Longimicrobiales bacterium]